MILYCIRHCESIFNAQSRIQGQTDIPLSPLGQQQALALGAAFRETPLDAVYSSPLLRALDTAKRIAEACGIGVTTDDRLMEIHAGVFQSHTWEEIDQTHPREALLWKNHDPDFVIPGGESRLALAQRARAVFEAIRDAGYDRVAVVSHGGTLAAAIKSLLDIPIQNSPFSFYNGSITQLAWNRHVKLITLNQVDHLKNVGAVPRQMDAD